MKRLALLALVALAASACGGGGGSKAYSAADVKQEFKEKTGRSLAVHDTPGYDQLDFAKTFGAPIARQDKKRFGDFWIVVFKRDPKRQLDGALEGQKADAQGIYWYFTAPKGPWIARSTYGENVLVNWIAGPSKRVDARWKRLNAALSGL